MVGGPPAAPPPPPPHAQHTHARAHTCSSAGLSSVDCSTHTRARTLAPTLVGADVLGGPLHLPVLPLTSLSSPPRLKKYKKRARKPVSGSSRAHILKWLNLLAPNRSVAQALRFRVSITPAHERSPGVRCIRATLGAGRPHGSPTLVGSGAQWPRCDAQWPWRGAQWNAPTLVGARVSRARPSPRSEPPHSVPRWGRAAGDVGPYHRFQSPHPPHFLSLFVRCIIRPRSRRGFGDAGFHFGTVPM